MQIRHLAEQTRLTVDTIRFYEKKGLISHTHFSRRENGYREYTDGAIERLEMIKLAQAAGFSLAEIVELFALWDENRLTDELILAHLREKRQHIANKIAELEQIQRYVTDKIRQMERDLHATDAADRP
jgi:DNA-binding transcriptional MerR regulator